MKYKRMLAACCMALICVNSTAKDLMPDLLSELKDLGFSGVTNEPFAFSKEGLAWTVLHRSAGPNEEPQKGLTYFVRVLPLPDGVAVVFGEYQQECKIAANESDVSKQIIIVNGQKINAISKCLPTPGKTENSSAYFAQSKAGNDFIIKQFREKELVIVYLNNVPVPFKTKGFKELAAKLGGKAL